MKNILLSLAVGGPSLLFAGTAKQNLIDDADSYSKVRAIMKQAEKDFEKFIFFGEEPGTDDTCGTSKGLPRPQAWIKADFDGNGFTDLLVTGHYYSDRNIICILDKGNNNFYYKFISRKVFNECCSATLFQTASLPAILYQQVKYEWFPGIEGRFVLHTDTLVFRYGDFVELKNTEVPQHRIDSISISTTGCFGTCPIFEMRIAPDRKATYHAEMYNKKKGDFKGTIKEKDYNELTGLLNYIGFASLQDGYAVNWTDDQTVTVIITYDGGKTKKIEDYGLIGTFGLNRVYSMLYDFRENQSWR